MSLRETSRVLVALVALLLVGGVMAQGPMLPTDYGGAARDFARVPGGWVFTPDGTGTAQLPSQRPSVQLAGGASLTSRPVRTLARSVGRFAVRWGGVITIGASVIYSALDWFYQEAGRMTGTPLDDWYYFDPVTSGEAMTSVYSFGRNWNECGGPGTGVYTFRYAERVQPGSQNWQIMRDSSNAPVQHTICADSTQFGVNLSDELLRNVPPPPVLHSNPSYANEIVGWEVMPFSVRGYDPTERARPVAFLPVSEQREPLVEHLLDNLNTSAPAADRILREGLEARANSPGWPFGSYGAPYGTWDVSLSPAPNQNQWYGNPYANPTIDTDGDGVEDWREAESGTDPNDPAHFPTVPVVVPVRPEPGDPEYDPVRDPTNPNYDPEQDPWRDLDGDGIPDRFDPCPRDALNRCMDSAPEHDPASEDTLQEIRDLLEEIRDQEKQEEEDDVMPADFGPLTLLLPEWTPGAVTESAFAAVSTAMEATVNGAIGDGGGKLPFLMSGWVPIVALTGGDECTGISMDILGYAQEVGVCDTPVHTVLATTARTAILALAVLAFWLGMVRWVSQS